MTVDRSDHIIGQVILALDEIDSVSLAVTFRRASRIAQLRGDTYEVSRIALELEGIGHPFVNPFSSATSTAESEIIEDFRQGRYSTVTASLLGLPAIEPLTQLPLDSLVDSLVPKAVESTYSQRTQMNIANRRVVARTILARLQSWVHSYLVRCEVSILFGSTGESIFQRHRIRVDKMLASVSPDVLEKLNAALKRASEHDEAESRSQALLSCRRVLLAVADEVFPASEIQYVDTSGTSRSVGRSQYLNRLLAFVESADLGTRGLALNSQISLLASAFEFLDDLLQKGVHSEITSQDMDFGVIQTYLVAGEILTVASD
jgi:hypothetical protein